MSAIMIADVFAGRVPMGQTVRVQGWVRTRRDSKAGVSFIHLHDGSCFAPLQIVAASTLPNYESAVLKLTTGCALVAEGELVESQGKGQTYEVQASSIEVIEQGPLRACLEVRRKILHSDYVQRISLTHNSRRLDFSGRKDR